MRTGRPKRELIVKDEEQVILERWVRRPTTGQALARRARIILSCATGKTNGGVATELGMDQTNVGKWRARFIARGIDGLLDVPRPGAPRTIADADV